MKKLIVFILVAVALQIVIAQTGMLNFKQDLAGNAASSAYVPVDGGMTMMIMGTALYAYRKMFRA